MAIQKIPVAEFIERIKHSPVIDVRSPAEYKQAHIPGAYSVPLFSDEERKITGTAYKQQSRETAIKIGLDFFGPKMTGIVEEAENIIANYRLRITNRAALNSMDLGGSQLVILLHCWRGGMRSAAVAWLLDLYGFKVCTLAGGYKAYRNWVLRQLQKTYQIKIIGGYTGSGKTLLLHELQKQGKAVIDIEAHANHKGSALGGLGKGTQPRQEMFENLLAENLFQQRGQDIFIEDESQRIGDLQIPMALWYTMRKSPVYFFDIPFEERLNYVTKEYSTQEKDKLINAIVRIQKRLGGLEAKNAINFLSADNHKESFRILLKYYDKYYLKGLYNRDNAEKLIHIIVSDSIRPEVNLEFIKNIPQISKIDTEKKERLNNNFSGNL